ncbi:MAG: hypothetical protein KC416_06985, partial [Myxococcales bacterium]|nr:hypothetical protein [Myxococcales bacterium]
MRILRFPGVLYREVRLRHYGWFSIAMICTACAAPVADTPEEPTTNPKTETNKADSAVARVPLAPLIPSTGAPCGESETLCPNDIVGSSWCSGDQCVVQCADNLRFNGTECVTDRCSLTPFGHWATNYGETRTIVDSQGDPWVLVEDADNGVRATYRRDAGVWYREWIEARPWNSGIAAFMPSQEGIRLLYPGAVDGSAVPAGAFLVEQTAGKWIRDGMVYGDPMGLPMTVTAVAGGGIKAAFRRSDQGLLIAERGEAGWTFGTLATPDGETLEDVVVDPTGVVHRLTQDESGRLTFATRGDADWVSEVIATGQGHLVL